MTQLTLDARNFLAQDPDLRALLGRSVNWPTWVFDSKPYGKLEGSQSSLIVINEAGNWQPRNEHNSQTFPRLRVDIWSDPTRNENGSVKVHDADDKILDIRKILDRHLHLRHNSITTEDPDWWGTPGSSHFWGTAEQVANKTGTLVIGSSELGGPDLVNVTETEGARMGTLFYGVSVS
jgi:hypothetical protein